MRNLIFGAIGVLWGGGVLWYSFMGNAPRGGGAYGAGQMVGGIFGLLLFVAGLYYLIGGIREVVPDQPRRKPRKPKREPRPIKSGDSDFESERSRVSTVRVRCPECGHKEKIP